MGTLRAVNSERKRLLPPRATVGRLASCDLRLMHPRVSGNHAALSWTDAGWQVKDLSSRNGTTLNGKRLAPGVWCPLAAGAALVFGDASEAWMLEDAAPPPPLLAIHLADGPAVSSYTDSLAVPDAESPKLIVRRDDAGWVAETPEGVRMLNDEAVLTVAGHPYRLFLPSEAVVGTLGETGLAHSGVAGLHFAVSQDEEHIQLQADGITPVDLGARVHHYLLLLLARQRLDDLAQGADDGEAGWLYRDALARMMSVDRAAVALYLFRARRQLVVAGFTDLDRVLERRTDTNQLRLVAPVITIRRA